MNLVKRKIILIMITIAIFCALSASYVLGASVNASFSGGGSYEKGDTVVVKLTYSGSKFGTAKAEISYDSSYLQYESCSSVAYGSSGILSVSMTASGNDTLSCTVQFKAIKAGNTNISANTLELYNLNEESLSVSSKSVNINIKNAEASVSGNANLSSLRLSAGSLSPSFSPNTTTYSVNVGNDVTTCTMSASTADPKATYTVSGSSSLAVGQNTRKITVTAQNGNTKTYTINIYRAKAGEEDPDDKEQEEEEQRPAEIKVSVGEKEYIIVENFDNKDIPQGFAITVAKLGDYEIPAFADKGMKYTLVLLKDGETGDEVWFFYDEEKDEFFATAALTADEIIAYEEAIASQAKGTEEDENLFKTETVLYIALGVTCAALLAVIIALQVKLRKKEGKTFE